MIATAWVVPSVDRTVHRRRSDRVRLVALGVPHPGPARAGAVVRRAPEALRVGAYRRPPRGPVPDGGDARDGSGRRAVGRAGGGEVALGHGGGRGDRRARADRGGGSAALPGRHAAAPSRAAVRGRVPRRDGGRVLRLPGVRPADAGRAPRRDADPGRPCGGDDGARLVERVRGSRVARACGCAAPSLVRVGSVVVSLGVLVTATAAIVTDAITVPAWVSGIGLLIGGLGMGLGMASNSVLLFDYSRARGPGRELSSAPDERCARRPDGDRRRGRRVCGVPREPRPDRAVQHHLRDRVRGDAAGDRRRLPRPYAAPTPTL